MNRNDVHKGYISKMSLHDRELLGAIVGLAKTCGNNPYTDNTIKLICDALLAFNEGCDKAQAEEWLERLHKEKYNISPGCAVCQARCGNTDDYDISLILGEEQDKLGIKQELIVHSVLLSDAAIRNTELYSDEEYRLVLLGVLTVLSYEMSLKGLENAAEQAERWEVQ